MTIGGLGAPQACGAVGPIEAESGNIARASSDEQIVGRRTIDTFWGDAAGILEAAIATTDAEATAFTILIGEAGIRMVADSDWPLPSLQALHGATAAYRVRRAADQVRVEGRAGGRTCLFEAAKPGGAARLLLGSRPVTAILPRGGSAPLLPAASD